MTQTTNKTLRIIDSLIIWAAIFVATIVPLVFWPAKISTSYPLIYIYLFPKAIVLGLGARLLLLLAAIRGAAGVVVWVRKRNRLFKDPGEATLGTAIVTVFKKHWTGLIDLLPAVFIVLLWFSSKNGLNYSHAFYGSIYWLEGFYTYLNYIIIFYVGRVFGNEKAVIKLAWALIVSTILISVYAIVEAFYPVIQTFTNVGFAGRSGATAGNAVILGAYLVLPLALIGGLLAQRVLKGVWAGAALTALGLGLPAAAFTFSRGTWLALAAVSLVVAWQVSIRNWPINIGARRRPAGTAAPAGSDAEAGAGRRWRPAQLAVLTAAFLVIIAGPKSPQLVARAFSAFNPTEPTVETRLAAWGQAVQLAKKYPVWGTGIDSFAEGAARSLPPDQVVDTDKPHNFPLEILSTMGVPAFFAFALFLLAAFYAGAVMVLRRLAGHEVVLAGLLAVAGYLIALFFLFSTVNSAPLFYLILGLTMAALRQAPKEAAG